MIKNLQLFEKYIIIRKVSIEIKIRDKITSFVDKF